MRVADGKPPAMALLAAGSIAQMMWRADIGFSIPSFQQPGSRISVKPALSLSQEAPLLSERRPWNQARFRSAILAKFVPHGFSALSALRAFSNSARASPSTFG